MRILPLEFVRFLRHRASRENVGLLMHMMLVVAGAVVLFSALFQALMALEGQSYDWITAVYWTITVMTTLGFGDIVFASIPGKILSVVVVSSGLLILLVLIPFTFIRFFQSEARVPRGIPGDWKGHVILTHHDSVTHKLIRKLERFRFPYVILIPDLQKALSLYDQGINVVWGDLDSLDSYRRLQVDRAALVATTASDEVNTNVTITVRELSNQIPIIATAQNSASVDILQLAGSSYVLQLDRIMGEYLARRTLGGEVISQVIGQIGQLLISEAMTAGTPLVGKTLQESRLRETAGINVIGIWERGRFKIARREAKIGSDTVLVLAGSQDQMNKYNQLFGAHHASHAPVLIIGGGRVGRATGAALAHRKIDYRIIEKSAGHILDDPRIIVGNAAERDVLEKAGIMDSPAVVVTTHDDDTNIYLTTYCRRLRPDIQIISRAARARNVHTLHRAGADFCMSYSSMGTNIIFNRLKRTDILMVAEGLDVFTVKVPSHLAGKTISQTSVREDTGCSIVSVTEQGRMIINPEPSTVLPPDGELILIGTVEAEELFLSTYGEPKHLYDVLFRRTRRASRR